nr:helicase [Tanacetum cinerariifolium]
MELTELMDDLTKRHVFRDCCVVVYVIAFQKQGLPYVHILLLLEERFKCMTPDEINDIISAELPSPTKDSVGYKVVSEFMLHGPCSKDTKYAPCTTEGKCLKHYPVLNYYLSNQNAVTLRDYKDLPAFLEKEGSRKRLYAWKILGRIPRPTAPKSMITNKPGQPVDSGSARL